jgi:hypothetical protein
MKKTLIVVPVLFVIFLTSCTSYFMTTANFQQQLRAINDSTIKYQNNFQTGLVLGLVKGQQFNNGIRKLECIDIAGKKVIVDVNHNTQIRLTNNRGKKQIYYFDTMFLRQDTIVLGKISRYKDFIVPMKLSDIAKVEVQSPTSSIKYVK